MDGPTLDITAGLHSGVARQLHRHDYRVGSASGADIILGDPGVEPEHAVLRIERYGARIEARGGDVGLGAEVLSRGHGCRLSYPFELSLGGARLRLSGTAETGFLRPMADFIARRPQSVAAGVIGAVLLLALMASRSPHGGNRPSPDDGPVHLPAETANAADAARELNDRLNAAGVRGLKVTAIEGQVAVSGVIASSSLGAWTAVQQWFDKTYTGRLVLTANVTVGESKNPSTRLRLQAVWFGEHPYVITDDGVRRYEGGPLDDGWVIREIRDDHVLLVKDGQTLRLTYP
jgi:hypothetical protein